MKRQINKFLANILLKNNIIIALLGIILLGSIMVISKYPECRTAILASCISGGLINIMNGLRINKDPKRRTAGMPFIMLGAIIIVMGFFIINRL